MSNLFCVDCGHRQAIPRTGTVDCRLCHGQTILICEDSEIVRPERVYVCSPLQGDYYKNLAFAKMICRRLSKGGILPIAPHVYFTSFLDDADPKDRDIGRKQGLELLDLCDEVWVYGNRISYGMRVELLYANARRKRIRIKPGTWEQPNA